MTEDTGQRVGGRYVLRSQLGSGGAGTVWLADDELLERAVAVKAVRMPESLPEEERAAARRRVLREARAAARLNHPGVVTVFDVFDEDECAYLVMELVRAPSLQEVVDREGPLEPTHAAELGLQLLGALEAAHAAGIVHRDVKPSNVLVRGAGSGTLTDFGIATVAGDSRMTATGLVLGSPDYIAPEQAREGAGQAPADLWGLGATLYFAVEGVPPFQRGQPLATMHAVLHEDPRPFQQAGVLEPVLAAMLTKDPARRPTVAEVRRRLQAASADPDPTPVRSVAATQHRPAETSVAPWWRRPATVVAAAALLTLGAVSAAAALLDGDPGAPKPREQAAQEPGPGQDPQHDPDATADADPQQAPAETPQDADDEAGEAPQEWVPYTDDRGWTIAHPPDWEVVDRGATITDFRDPGSPAYMRVDYTDSPPASAVQAWEELSASFAANRTDYTELRIEPVTFQGFDGALWEYTYREGGAALRAANLGFGTDEFGHALNFQTAAEDWDDLQGHHDDFRRSFRPAVP